MGNKLEVGQTYEVEEILKDETYHSYKLGGHTVDTETGDRWLDGLNVLENGQTEGYDSSYYLFKEELKLIGRLTVKKVK